MHMYLMLFLTILFENLSLALFWPIFDLFSLNCILLYFHVKCINAYKFWPKNLKFGQNGPDICTKKVSIDFLIFRDLPQFRGIFFKKRSFFGKFWGETPQKRPKSRNIKKSILTFFCAYIRVILAKFQVFWSKFVGVDTFYVKVQ